MCLRHDVAFLFDLGSLGLGFYLTRMLFTCLVDLPVWFGGMCGAYIYIYIYIYIYTYIYFNNDV